MRKLSGDSRAGAGAGAGQDGCNIEQDSGAVSQKAGDVAKDNLPHRIVRADVEHIDPPQRVAHKIQYSCQKAACQIDSPQLSEI